MTEQPSNTAPPTDDGIEDPESASIDPSSSVHPSRAARSRSFCLKNVLWVTFFLVLTIATRCANYRNVFVTSAAGSVRQVYFIDGDCYSRMTRVKRIMEHWGVIHYHEWENFPKGTWPHTTLPMDYLIAGLALLLKPFMADYLDVAGAIVSPLLGVGITAFLALWARELNQQYRRLMLLLVSLSPIIVHGTELGRPDHQSLQMFLLAVGIGAELIMARAPCIRWGIISGAAWGLALWVSLYEPLVLMVVLYVTKLIFYRPKLFVKERLWGMAVLFAILGIAYLLEGSYLVKSFTIEAHDDTLRDYFRHWTDTIGEMAGAGDLARQSGSELYQLLFRWVGLGLLVAPLLLIARLRDTKRTTLLLALLVVTFTLTLMESRWGYFFALIYAMSLPWQLSLVRAKWMVWTLFLLSLWPIAQDWDDRLFPNMEHDLSREVQMNDKRRIRQAAEFIGEKAPGGILAPWWWSPELVYWSGQPAVAGSSHESLEGIVDSARFYTATDGLSAKAILDNSFHILGQPPQILGQTPRNDAMADILWEKPHSAPIYLHVVFDNNVVKVFEVNHGSIRR